MTNLSSLVQPPPSEGVREAVRAWLLKHRATDNSDHVAAWGIFDARGTCTQDIYRGTVCNSAVATGEWIVGVPTCEAPKWWLRWFTEESFAAPFLTFDDPSKAVIISGGLPANLVVSILTLQRMPREMKPQVTLMRKLMDAGCGADLAYLLAMTCSSISNQNHNPVCPPAAKVREYYANYLARRALFLKQPYRESSAYRGGITALWIGEKHAGGPYAFYSLPTPEEFLAEFPKKRVDVERVVIPNPFAPVVKSTSVWNETMLFDILPTVMETFHDDALKLAA